MKYQFYVAFMFLCVIGIGFASANLLDIKSSVSVEEGSSIRLGDNEISYKPIWNTYQPIEISSLLGLGGVKFSGAITEHTSVCGEDCSSIMNIYISDDNPLVDEIKFYTLNGNERIEQPIRSYQFYIQDGLKDIEVPDYREVCKINKINGTDVNICKSILAGTKIIKEENWIRYNIGDILPSGNYVLKLEGQKKAGKTVDWIITTRGERITEWATWVGSGVQKLGTNLTDDSNNQFGGANFSTTSFVSALNSIDIVQIYVSTYSNYRGRMNVSINYKNLTGEVPNSTVIGNIFSDYQTISGTGWKNFTFSTSVPVVRGKEYFIVFNSNYTVAGELFRIGESGENGGYNLSLGGQLNAMEAPYVNKKNITITLYGNTTATILPNVTLNSPIENYNTTSLSITFNCSASNATDSSSLTNISYYDNSTGTFQLRETKSVTGLLNTTTFSRTFDSYKNYKWGCSACDNEGDCGFSTNRTFSILQFIGNLISYNSSALETTRQGYTLNATIDISHWIAQSASFYFNNTLYSTIKSSSGNNIIFTSNIDLPSVNADTNKNLLWQLQLTNTTGNYLFNTSTYTQTITKTQFARCGTVANVTFLNFTTISQTDFTTKIATNFKATFNYWAGDGSIKSSYTYQESGTPTNSSFPFCLEPNSSTINIDVDVEYGNIGGYAQNYFYYRNKQLTNNPTNQSLYLINSTLATITTLRAIDSYQNGLVGYIGYINYHDVGTNTDKLVGMFKTNYNGQDIAYLNWYDSLYKFDIYNANITSLVYTTEPFKISATPQTFRIETVSTAINWLYFQDVAYNLSVNNNTGVFLLTFNDPNNHLTAGCLRIIYYNSGNASILSDQCANGTSGTLTYTANSGNGTYYGIFYGKGSIGTIDYVIFTSLDYLNDIYSQLGNLDGTILAIMVISLAAFIGLVAGPVAFIMMAIIGYIAVILLGFQSMNSGNFQIAFFGFLAIGGYLMWKLRT